MIRGVRRPEEIVGMGLSKRLIVRIGALLKKQMAFSAPVLELATPGTTMERLLLDPGLLTVEASNNELARILAQPRLARQGNALAVATAGDGVSVICLQEEFDALEGWGESWGQQASTEATCGEGVAQTSAGATIGRKAALNKADLAYWDEMLRKHGGCIQAVCSETQLSPSRVYQILERLGLKPKKYRRLAFPANAFALQADDNVQGTTD